MSDQAFAHHSNQSDQTGNAHPSYQQLLKLADEMALLDSTASVLGWDQETYMPAASLEWRARQVARLRSQVHELSVSPERHKLLEQAAQDQNPDPVAAANVAEWLREFERDRRIPTELVERRSVTSSRAKNAWAQARRESDFSRFAPHLRKIIDLQLEMAELWGYPDEPYDALLEGYERGLTARQTVELFDRLEPELREIGRAAAARSAAQAPPRIQGEFPIEVQQAFNRKVAAAFGFDFEAGRIDATTHPFCTTLGPADVRLTTRYRTDDFTESLFCVLHETGHGLYEQGLPGEYFGTPAGSAASLGIHESQSRLWENHIGRSREFWSQWLPRAREVFPSLPDYDLDTWMSMILRAEPSFIRVEADESTYDLHILLRFRIERELLRGEIAVEDVPARWNEQFEQSFGLVPPDDARGCLQDIHWSMGGMGYFPTYTLGNLVAAQLYSVACQDATIPTDLGRNDYRSLGAWMNREIHRHGGVMTTNDLVRQATGKDLDPGYHLAHLRQRYLGTE